MANIKLSHWLKKKKKITKNPQANRQVREENKQTKKKHTCLELHLQRYIKEKMITLSNDYNDLYICAIQLKLVSFTFPSQAD